MEIKTGKRPGTILIDCSECGRDFEMEDFREEFYNEIFLNSLEKERWCPECRDRIIAAENQEKKERTEKLRKLAFRTLPDEAISSSGLPPGYCFERATNKLLAAPIVRYAAEWLWQNRKSNVLMSGVTGAGKSTSAVFVAMKMIEEENAKLRYYTLGQLLSLWRSTRRSEDPEADLKFLWRLFGQNELTIIDEVVGKARISDSGQELLFDILEAVNNGECRSRIWLLGNFYRGSIEAIFADPDPIRRRIAENFICVRLDPDKKECVKLKVLEK